jgi:hypothetical protein
MSEVGNDKHHGNGKIDDPNQRVEGSFGAIESHGSRTTYHLPIRIAEVSADPDEISLLRGQPACFRVVPPAGSCATAGDLIRAGWAMVSASGGRSIASNPHLAV